MIKKSDVLKEIIDDLQNKLDQIEEVREDYRITIEVLEKEYEQLTTEKELPLNTPKETKSNGHFVEANNMNTALIFEMLDSGTVIINARWVANQFKCSYFAAAKRIKRALEYQLLEREGEVKGVYHMTPQLQAQIEEEMKKSTDKIDVKKLVEILMIYSKGLKEKAQKIEEGLQKPQQEKPARSATQAIREILRQATTPLHGINHIHVRLVKDGYKIPSASVGKICSAMPDVERVGANTWRIKSVFGLPKNDVVETTVLPAN